MAESARCEPARVENGWSQVALEDFLRSAGGCDQSEFGQHDAER
ncbi:MAG: hypothetical protein KatS3mg110_4104 [Pirellulaceae bacterium]|nr:MAG: hypothetical protein KatS3mg110_4104 [Pirellulaceae bacterium]